MLGSFDKVAKLLLIDEWVATRISRLRRALFGHVKHRSMRGKEDIAWERLQIEECLAIVFDDVGIFRVVDELVSGRAGTTEEDDVIALAVFFCIGCPGRAAFRVSGSEVSGHD